MPALNSVTLMGNLTKDPEVRYTPSGTAVCDLRMAVNRRFRTADGENKDETCFVGVTAWGRQAETAGEYLQKGSSLLVEGRLKYDEWEKDGQKNSRLTVVARNIQFLGDGSKGDGEKREPHPEAVRDEQKKQEAEEERSNVPGDDDNLPF